ncbi:MAG TPA: PP2C family protein-serine/threonine phosphatase [Spirochaetota bacterium]|nr:PP2C family protein-serine/threonine phosphatase [Spirochaetota bacterium]
MKLALANIVGDPNKTRLEDRIYNALTFFASITTIIILPLTFLLDISVYHVVMVLFIAFSGFYLYYLSRFRNTTAVMLLVIIGIISLSVIWFTGYGSTGYAHLFFQFITLFVLLSLEGRRRIVFFLLVPAVIIALTWIESLSIIPLTVYRGQKERWIDSLINCTAWLLATGFMIKIIVDNFRKERTRVEDELEVARRLQMRLLPGSEPEIPGFSLHAVYRPMEKVGGDFYDYCVTDDAVELFVADVTGHGLSSAFLATITKMAFDYERSGGLPAEVLTRLNHAVLRSTVDNNFVTAVYCVIDREDRVMRCARAGHFPPMLFRRAGRAIEEIRPPGKPLGWLENPGIIETEIRLSRGDRLVLYTDGVTECFNGRGQMFGIGRFKDLILAHHDLPPADFCSLLLEELRGFSGSEILDDDITLMVLDVR